MKKFISVLVALSLTLAMQITFANAQSDTLPDYGYEVNMLDKIGVFSGVDLNKFGPNDYITYDDYMHMIKNVICGIDASYELNEFSRNYGFIKETSTLTRSSYVTFDFALKSAIKLLGYENVAEVLSDEGYTYILQANRIGITKGLNYSSGEVIKFVDIAKLVYETLNENMLELSSIVSDKEEYSYEYKKSDETVLNRYMNIYDYEGIVTGTPYTAMYGDSTFGESKIGIDEYIFYSDNPEKFDAEDLVGTNVTAYYSDVDGNNKLVAIVPAKNNKTLTIDANSIVSYDEKSREIEYYNSNDKKKTLELEQTAAVIYNNRGLTKYTASDFDIIDGYVTFTDNDGNGSYDVANIKSYTYVLTDAIYRSGSDVSITNKITFDNNVKIETDNGDLLVIRDTDGNEMKVGNIERNDLLTVIYNKEAENKKVEITVSKNSVSGKPSSIEGGYDKITIDGDEYEMSDYYSVAKASKEKYTPEIKLGNMYVFYLNTEGKIVAAKLADNSDYSYGYLKTASIYKVIDSECKIKVFTQSGDWEILTLNEKIHFNDSDKKIKSENVLNETLGVQDNTYRQMIAYRLDSNGNVCELRTAVDEDTTDDENAFTKGKTGGLPFRYAKTYSFGTQYFVEPGAVAFIIPNDDDEDKYAIVSIASLVANESYNVCGYNGDRFKCYDFFTINVDYDDYQTKIAERSEYFVIDDVRKAVSGSGDVVTRLYGITGFLTTFSMDLVSTISGDDLKCGDVIRFNKDAKGNINYYTKVFDIDTKSCPTVNDSTDVPYRALSGSVVDVDYEKYRIKIENNGVTSYVYSDASGKFIIYENNGRTGSTRNGTISDIELGDIVFSSTNYGCGSNVYVVK